METYTKSELDIRIHSAIKKVGECIESQRYNIGVSTLMELLKYFEGYNKDAEEKERNMIRTKYSMFVTKLIPILLGPLQ